MTQSHQANLYFSLSYFLSSFSIFIISQVRAVQAIGCGHVTKLALHWRQPWWAKGEGNLTLAWSNDEMRARVLPRDWPEYIFNLTEVENQPKVLMAWIAGSGARVVDQLDEDEVVLGITELLRK